MRLRHNINNTKVPFNQEVYPRCGEAMVFYILFSFPNLKHQHFCHQRYYLSNNLALLQTTVRFNVICFTYSASCFFWSRFLHLKNNVIDPSHNPKPPEKNINARRGASSEVPAQCSSELPRPSDPGVRNCHSQRSLRSWAACDALSWRDKN